MFSTMGIQLQRPFQVGRTGLADSHGPGIVIDEISESGGIHDSEAETDAILLDVYNAR